ncbi:MAG TPA: ASKHA domain-containing protein [Syntrophales bacterium]|nr:ASKHA domain-containing protein [Syntrophales bacterium]
MSIPNAASSTYQVDFEPIGKRTEVKAGLNLLEAAHVSDGMRAASGAIEAVSLTDTGLILKTVDNAPAVGLCGSGIIDVIAELHRWNLINERGRFGRQNGQVRSSRHGPEFLLVPGSHSGSRRFALAMLFPILIKRNLIQLFLDGVILWK